MFTEYFKFFENVHLPNPKKLIEAGPGRCQEQLVRFLPDDFPKNDAAAQTALNLNNADVLVCRKAQLCTKCSEE